MITGWDSEEWEVAVLFLEAKGWLMHTGASVRHFSRRSLNEVLLTLDGGFSKEIFTARHR